MHEPKRPRLALLLALALACGAAADEPAQPLSPDAFAYRQPLALPAGPDGALVRLPLTPAVYHSVTRADLGDLRVFNAGGQALPYSIVQPPPQDAPAAPVPARLFPLPAPAAGQDLQHLVLQIQQQEARISLNADAPPRPHGGGYVVDLSVAAQDGKLPALDSLTLDWRPVAGGFNQAVGVQASDDLTHWQPVSIARIVQLEYLGETLRQNTLLLDGARARYLLLSWGPGETPPELTAAHVKPLSTPAQPAMRLAMSIPLAPTAVTAAGEYAFDAGNPIGAESLQFDLPPGSLIIATILVRDDPAQAWRPVAGGNFFRLAQGDVQMVNPPLALGRTVHARYWLVRADPRSSSLPAPPAKLDLTWTPEEVVFLAQPPGPYELAFGNPTVASAALPPEVLVTGYAQDPAGTLSRLGIAAIGGSAEAASPTAAGIAGPAPVAAADVTLTPANPSALLPPAPTPPWRDWRTWLAWGALLLGVGLLGWMALRLVRQMRAAG